MTCHSSLLFFSLFFSLYCLFLSSSFYFFSSSFFRYVLRRYVSPFSTVYFFSFLHYHVFFSSLLNILSSLLFSFSSSAFVALSIFLENNWLKQSIPKTVDWQETLMTDRKPCSSEYQHFNPAHQPLSLAVLHSGGNMSRVLGWAMMETVKGGGWGWRL